MINMQSIYSHDDYSKTVHIFTKLECRWSVFKTLHKDVANHKCPICEVELVYENDNPYSATIDHFRPQAIYPYLKCEPKNYILMCGLCNNRYKESHFPLFDESKRAGFAKTLEETHEELPLLFNPAEEDPINFFELVFRQTPVGNILELKVHSHIHIVTYDYLRSETMIRLFGLGYVNEAPHENTKTNELRVDILRGHYETFIELARAIKDNNIRALKLIMDDKNRKEMLQKYGFFQFLSKRQFSIG